MKQQKKLNSNIFVNVQGDEPTIKASDIKKIITAKKIHPNHVICGYTKINISQINNLNIPKVVMNKNNELIYISRPAIPGTKKKNLNKIKFFKQVCIYAFNYNELKIFGSFTRKGFFRKN